MADDGMVRWWDGGVMGGWYVRMVACLNGR